MVMQFKVLSLNLLGAAEEKYEKPQSGYSMSRTKFEPGTSRKNSETIPVEQA
jgi:hypothetical protein